MTLKKHLIVVLITSSFFTSFGQERINREKINFKTESESLLKATGWAYNSTSGEWIEYQNVISDNKDYREKSLTGRLMMSTISQNFKKIQTKTINYKGTVYYVIIVDKYGGSRDREKTWVVYDKTIGYIFTKKEYQKLLNINKPIELKSHYMVSLGSKKERYNETKFLNLIQTELSEKKESYMIMDYSFLIMKSKKGFIRFYLPDYYYQKNFKKAYFETEFENFKKIILK